VALKSFKGVIAASTTLNATQTPDISAAAFSSGEPLRAIMFWTVGNTAAGQADADSDWCQGFATNDGGAIQMGYMAGINRDATTNENSARGMNTTAALKFYNTSAPAIEAIMTVTTFTDTSFTVTWTDPPPAAVRVHFLALGGADVTAARVISWAMTATVATQNVTVNTGFGQPDLLIHTGTNVTALGDSTGGFDHALGVAASDTARRAVCFWQSNNTATMVDSATQRNRAYSLLSSVSAVGAEFDMSARGSYPTDGFQVSYATQASSAFQVISLAMKAPTVAVTIGAANTQTTTTNQDLAHTAPPTTALSFMVPIPSTASVDQSHADLGGMHLGAWDGTNQGAVEYVQNNADATGSCGTGDSATAFVRSVVAVAAGTSAPTLAGESSASASGNNLRLPWASPDATAREFSYVLLSSAAAAAAPAVRRAQQMVPVVRAASR
jgi:hypothetical protein